MTEHEITQARENLAQLGIEQLRSGVMLQLLKIEALTKERDSALEQNTFLDARCAKLEAERDALTLGNRDLIDWFDALKSDHDKLMAAGKLALESLVAQSRTTKSNVTLVQILTAITSLRQAGVQ